jgi:hypothetical protein
MLNKDKIEYYEKITDYLSGLAGKIYDKMYIGEWDAEHPYPSRPTNLYPPTQFADLDIQEQMEIMDDIELLVFRRKTWAAHEKYKKTARNIIENKQGKYTTEDQIKDIEALLDAEYQMLLTQRCKLAEKIEDLKLGIYYLKEDLKACK